MSYPSGRFRVFLLVVFLGLVCCRMPDILLKQRLWAEEGLFYQNAWVLPAWRAVLFPYAGYLNIVANAAAVIARHTVGVVSAPLVMTGIGLLFQTMPAVLILTSRVRWLNSSGAMLLAVVALGAGPATEEVWLQTLHSQNHLALCVALILAFDDQPGPAVRWLRRAILFLAPLSGMLAVLVLPLLLARALLERSRERTIQLGILAAGAAIQIVGFYSPGAGAALGRSNTVWPGILIYTFFIRHLVTPLFGVMTAKETGDSLAAALKDGHSPLWPVAPLAVAGSLLSVASLSRWRSGAPWLFAAAVLIGVFSYFGAIRGGMIFLYPFASERYNFVPGILIVYTVLAIASDAPQGLVSGLATVVVCWMVAVGLLDYTRARDTSNASGPDWHAEVRLWQSDPTHLIKLWPEGWVMQLTPDHSPIRVPVHLNTPLLTVPP